MFAMFAVSRAIPAHWEESVSARNRDSIVSGSIRVVITESTYVTVQCGKCATRFETHVSFRTTRCKRCGRVCYLDQAALAAEAAPNVTPIRRKSAT